MAPCATTAFGHRSAARPGGGRRKLPVERLRTAQIERPGLLQTTLRPVVSEELKSPNESSLCQSVAQVRVRGARGASATAIADDPRGSQARCTAGLARWGAR